MAHETEDSRITGGTRSLLRRLLALNVGGSLSAKKLPNAKFEAPIGKRA